MVHTVAPCEAIRSWQRRARARGYGRPALILTRCSSSLPRRQKT